MKGKRATNRASRKDCELLSNFTRCNSFENICVNIILKGKKGNYISSCYC